eukprot:TRINITY_DN16182_c0_g1_i1.p1 TRINITY_DN16182_c0_g1~~TRINITY_DN16182_c0_g1_i1.p1  ORF type:complete len:329 (+),score=52.91 TRINITY_DN16182_c0_g1_i1:56-988(+)
MEGERAIVTPGDLLTSEASNWLHGKGTFTEDGELLSSLCGEVQMTGRMVQVQAPTGKYTGNTGDCIVGRVTSVMAGKWKVNVNGHIHAVLQLQNVNLPGGHLRRKTSEDERQMRALFRENDILSAEVQKVNKDGSLSLHTRSSRYGKLSGGTLVTVPVALIKRLSSHFHNFEFGIRALIGVNGLIWLSKSTEDPSRVQKKRRLDDSDSDDGEEHKNDLFSRAANTEAEVVEPVVQPLTVEDRVNIARLRMACIVLAQEFLEVSPSTMLDVFNASLAYQIRPSDMCLDVHRANIIQQAVQRIKNGGKLPKK